jgi:hypothetical protein
MPALAEPNTIAPVETAPASRPVIFRAPPLTPELSGAIALIAPHFNFRTDETARVTWERDQNETCWGEFDALKPVLTTMPAPKKILELGPGMGRSAVFFNKILGWGKSEFTLYEGDGNTTKYALLGNRSTDTFCGNIPLLQQCLAYNRMSNYNIVDAHANNLRDLPGGYQFIYSFYSIGFHWSLEHFLDDLLPLMDKNALAAFTIPAVFKEFSGLNAVAHEFVEWTPVWPKGAKNLRFLLLRT